MSTDWTEIVWDADDYWDSAIHYDFSSIPLIQIILIHPRWVLIFPKVIVVKHRRLLQRPYYAWTPVYAACGTRTSIVRVRLRKESQALSNTPRKQLPLPRRKCHTLYRRSQNFSHKIQNQIGRIAKKWHWKERLKVWRKWVANGLVWSYTTTQKIGR